ncbi:MAG: hypothetical protein ACLR7U_09340 [Ruthenibacterium lactatiformans]
MKTGKRLDVLLQATWMRKSNRGDHPCGLHEQSGYQTTVVCPTSVLAGRRMQAFDPC